MIYNADNVTEVFEYFKEKYDKRYKDDAEASKAFKNFVVNFNKVSNLNEATRDKDTFYIVNQYADMDPNEFNKHYAIRFKPYFEISNKKDAEFLGRERLRDINASELYDLDQAEELYNEFMKKYKKRNMTKRYDRQVHYYRFVKTLVEMNNNYFRGHENISIDETADVLKEPNEYFWSK
ncbi:unnamed protein product [Leptosia nina]|uniref:Cathepsin propeptide inhibitor domain-containing protein n=1 Tax=Leptosia nina TaxID=320188 RepID=A0AAV1JCK0_9NEOP